MGLYEQLLPDDADGEVEEKKDEEEAKEVQQAETDAQSDSCAANCACGAADTDAASDSQHAEEDEEDDDYVQEIDADALFDEICQGKKYVTVGVCAYCCSIHTTTLLIM